MKRLFALLFVSSVAYGDSSSLNLALPTTPQSYQSDKFRAGDLDCQNAIGSATNLEFGVVGVINREDPYTEMLAGRELEARDVGVYARITIPIGAPKERINCNTLYKLELEKKRLEVFKLRQELENLKALQFEN